MTDRPLKVLLYTRADAASNPGGDAVEARRVCGGLSAAGHRAVVADPRSDHGPDWDVVHLFNIDRAAELAVFLARHRSFPAAKVVLAPVWSAPAVGPEGAPARALRPVLNLLRNPPHRGRYLIPGTAVRALRDRVDALHLHTASEGAGFCYAYPGFADRCAIVPPPLAPPPGEPDRAASLPVDGPFIAMVGRLEPLKNQLWLVRSGLDRILPIVFVGGRNPKRPVYGRRFISAVDRNNGCHWLGQCDGTAVRALLGRAACHVLPSHRENFGLATLEALAAGCEAVVPSHHHITTALGDALHTFEPGDAAGLRAAIEAVLAGERRAHRFDRDRFTVEAVTDALLELYRGLFGRPPRRP
jgi:glycosyltransferase involved in cell wall biosynthesis